MVKEDIDKLKRTIEDAIEIYPDVVEAQESGDKLTILEGGALFVKHGGKLFKFAASIPEIGKEIIDLDSGETTEIYDQLIEHFGSSEEVQEAIRLIASGAGDLNQGIQKLIAAVKK